MNTLDHMFSSAYWKGAFWIPEDSVVQGIVRTGATACIEGRLEGDIHCKGKLVIRKNAVITGDAEALQVIVYGTVQGDLRAKKAIISRTAHIRGRVIADFVDMEKGALVEGLTDEPALPPTPQPPMPEEPEPLATPEEDSGSGQWF